jgi:hypothetical protein
MGWTSRGHDLSRAATLLTGHGVGVTGVTVYGEIRLVAGQFLLYALIDRSVVAQRVWLRR